VKTENSNKIKRRIELIYETSGGIKIFCEPGKKSKFDFKVKYKEPNKRIRTPKHIHVIIDLYMKLVKDDMLTLSFVDYLIDKVIKRVKPNKSFPPKLQVFNKEDIKSFERLNGCGAYSVEFLLVVVELIMIQEITNYPRGNLNLKLFQTFLGNHDDLFKVVSAATFR